MNPHIRTTLAPAGLLLLGAALLLVAGCNTTTSEPEPDVPRGAGATVMPAPYETPLPGRNLPQVPRPVVPRPVPHR